ANSAFSLIHSGLPRRWVWRWRLSSARTCQPSRTSRSTMCEPTTPAPPVTNARLAMNVCSGGRLPSQIQLGAQSAPLYLFLHNELAHKLPRMRGDLGVNTVALQF